MIFNNEDIGIGKIEADYNDIVIYSKNLKKSLFINFNSKSFEPNSFNGKTNIKDYFYFDSTFTIGETYSVFDISDFDIFLTKINTNEYLLELEIINPIIMFTIPSDAFNIENIKVKTKISFNTK